MIEKQSLKEESIKKIVDIFKDLDLFSSFRYFDLSQEEKEYTKREIDFVKTHIKKETNQKKIFCFKNENVFEIISINKLSNICNLQEKSTKSQLVKNYFGLLFSSKKTNSKHKGDEDIVYLGYGETEEEYITYINPSSLADKRFFILSFVFCMLNEGTKNKDTESFTLEYFKKEIERIEEILNELINSQKIEKLKKAIEEGKNIKDKETLKNLLEPFFQKDIIKKETEEQNKKSNLKFYLGILFFILISILIVYKKKIS